MRSPKSTASRSIASNAIGARQAAEGHGEEHAGQDGRLGEGLVQQAGQGLRGPLDRRRAGQVVEDEAKRRPAHSGAAP